ncbi:hypothetical protein [Nodularia chucula]|uniref:hypothetical protein n=1 Tax=Nodularia chucula TaxID=3093667 RepID=UPI0039C70623
MLKLIRKRFLFLVIAFITVTSVLIGSHSFHFHEKAVAANVWKFPWDSSVTFRTNHTRAGSTNGGWHSDGYIGTNNALDFMIPNLTASYDVLAPIDSEVLSFCYAPGGDYHAAIKLRASTGQIQKC